MVADAVELAADLERRRPTFVKLGQLLSTQRTSCQATEEHTAQQARAVELRDPVDLEPDLADVLLARCYEAMEELDAAPPGPADRALLLREADVLVDHAGEAEGTEVGEL